MRKAVVLPSPVSISVWWSFGSILGLLLVWQILSGFMLSMHYAADVESSFYSVIHLMRDVPMGWALRSAHANGASAFFVGLFVHIGRGLYYRSFLTQRLTWLIGVLMLLLSMATAFLGYVLPWGQMSFWGATVITNLLSAVPYFGTGLVEWVWGGWGVGQPTLGRFFALHFIMPFLLGGLSMLHLLTLHEKGSSNPLGSTEHSTKVSFHPFFTWKDMVGFVVVFLVLAVVCFFLPYLLGDPENFILANPLSTPNHIQPEWYFLFAYAILRCVPSKIGGVMALALSVLALAWVGGSSSRPSAFDPVHQVVFWIFVSTFLVLTWLGAQAVESPYLELSGGMSVMYFALLFLLLR